MSLQQTLYNNDFKTNSIVKLFFSRLTVLSTAPMVLGLLFVILAYIKKDWHHLIVVSFFALVFVFCWCIHFGGITLKIATNKLMINNNKLMIIYYGYLKKCRIELPLGKIDEISVSQNIFSKLLGYGKLSIRTISGSCNSIIGINAPYNVLKLQSSIKYSL